MTAAAPSPPATTLEALLDAVAGFARRFVVVSSAQADVVALWVAHTHAVGAAEATPYLAVTSAEKRSGKSRLLEVLALVSARPLRTAGVTEAALFRSLAVAPPPTLLMDEVDAIFGAGAKRDHEDLRALLNAGYRRGTPVLRCVGEGTKQRVEPFEVFGPKALAGIGRLPDTIADRSLPIRLKRRAPNETVERLRERDARAEAEPIREQLAAFAAAALDELQEARPLLPPDLDDRAQDACEPLVAIADLAGGNWPARGRAALVALRGSDEDGESSSLGVQLLADARAVFEARGAPQLPTAALVAALCELEEAPWQDLRGRPLTPRSLASILRPYRVRPHDLRVEERILKGYRRDDFTDAWHRYLPTGQAGHAAPAIAATSRDSRDNGHLERDPALTAAATTAPPSRNGDSRIARNDAVVAPVALQDPDAGEPQLLCPYPSHRGHEWRADDGRLLCGVCRPRTVPRHEAA